MERWGYERSSELPGWRGSLTDIATLAGRMGEMLGAGEVAAVVINESGGRGLEFSGPNELRAIADTIDARTVETIEIQAKRHSAAREAGTDELLSVRASRVNKRWRSGGLELLVIAPTQKHAARMHSELEHAVRQRIAARRLSWIGRAAGRPSFSLVAERRRSRPTRVGRIIEGGADVAFEALGTTIIAVVVLAFLRLL